MYKFLIYKLRFIQSYNITMVTCIALIHNNNNIIIIIITIITTFYRFYVIYSLLNAQVPGFKLFYSNQSPDTYLFPQVGFKS